ncbi:MAG: leucine-rich repeat protein [Clostridia bacterium]|nr:leucine-rich repeat protein [Clostridia bacterium]
MLVSTAFTVFMSATGGEDLGSSPYINRYEGSVDTGFENFLDGSVMYKLPSSIDKDQELSLIVMLKSTASVLDSYNNTNQTIAFTEYYDSAEAQSVRENVASDIDKMDSLLSAKHLPYEIGARYDTVFSGFEIIAPASEYESICELLSSDAVIVIGDEYEAAKTELVENEVDVKDTGIFNSDGFEYNGVSLNGSGTLVAVLDTGLDYYHTAFKDENFAKFNSGEYALTFEDVTALVNESDLRAEVMQSGLTASDVYISNKVPYAFDYADGDSDVYPLLSDHGTHVAGIIAGHDSVIQGVAPGAQLAIMKIFSDVMSTARSAWILAALEDCVALGVDVINMSIGTSCGFSTETDKDTIESRVYDKIRNQGISLVVAASNDFNSTYGSEKNGNLGLTSNPDSATVGSPGSYVGALSVASIEGAKTPYLLYNGSIIYFIESTDRVSEEKDFVEDLFKNLGTSQTTVQMQYVTIPGVGYTADYRGLDVTGKIALVRRGDSTFEEKVAVAEAQGAAGVIVYNNVSGDIKMNVGESHLPVCSISQDDGEMLAKVRNGTITVSINQTSGPFMSDFSSWGPTPDLHLKPEITAHGGSILSAVPGNSYDRISGTSMATPNISGLTSLLRQYVVERFGFDPDTDTGAINEAVNRLMMSTADIIINKNGTPYSVRKQGAGLANLTKSAKSDAYIITYDKDSGEAMDKSKIELGDDPDKSGKYTLVFSVKNFGTSSLSYNLSADVLTEGVSETKTSHGDTTVTETSYILDGAKVTLKSVEGGTKSGNKITVAAGTEAKVTLEISLSSKDKKYLDKSFENGMYVEGFVKLDAVEAGSVDMSVPYLAFYGDWTVAPQLDLDYFATNKDELDDAIDMEDKTLPDAYTTRPVGGTTGDYVSFLGSYYFIQKPGSTKIAADRKYISISNQDDTINSLRFVWAGLLRNAKTVVTTITDDATGEVVFTTTDTGVRKSYSSGLSIYPANIDIEFSAIEQNLKNNSSYTVTVQTYLDYGDGGEANNLNNTFTFPLVTDFEAPSITDCEFYTEYDRSAKKTRLFAKIAVYDNHYSMALQVGYISSATGEAVFHTFDRYLTPVYSNANSTTYVTYELTDYLEELKSSHNKNSFTVVAYDYAINNATYEIALPDEYQDFYFTESDNVVETIGGTNINLTLSPNQVYTLSPVVYPNTEWSEFITYTSSNKDVARIVGNKVVALEAGVTQISARFTLPDGTTKRASFYLKVLGPSDRGYRRYDKPVVDVFELTGYYTNKAFYQIASEDKDIGDTGNEMKFGGAYSLSMYPSESVTLRYKLIPYFPDDTTVVFESGNEKIVKVDKNGVITAFDEGMSSVTVKVLLDGKSTYYSQTITIEVKEPFVTSGPSLSHYYGSGTGNGGVVRFPSTLAITEIGQFAFSNYEYVNKDPSEMFPGDTDTMKPWYIGDNTITEIYVPEGVERIGPYAFANLTKLKTVHLSSTLTTIDYGAFENCTSLQNVYGLENVKFINQSAFEGCDIRTNVSGSNVLDLSSAVAIANFAFAGNKNLTSVKLPDSIQSIGAYAFAGNSALKSFTNDARITKYGQYVFSECVNLNNVRINASVVPVGMFQGCKNLTNITLGADVAVIGEYAFIDTKISKFVIEDGNTVFKPGTSSYIVEDDTILLVAPAYSGAISGGASIRAIANGAFSGNTNITSINLPNVTSVGSYAFSECTKLSSVKLGALTYIGDFAFENTAITVLPNISYDSLEYFGRFAFAKTDITSVSIPDGVTLPTGAFMNCPKLKSITLGDDVTVGAYAFATDASVLSVKTPYYNELYYEQGGKFIYYYDYISPIRSLKIGDNADIGSYAFLNASELHKVTLGDGAEIGAYAFYNCGTKLTKNSDNTLSYEDFVIDLSGVKSIGTAAFSGPVHMLFTYTTSADMTSTYMDYVYDENGEPIYLFYVPAIRSVNLSSATHIGSSAFEYNMVLKSVTLGEGVRRIGANAFYRCEALESVNLENVESVGKEAFANTALKTVDLSNATSIGEYSFCYNTALTSVTFAKEGVEIEEGAFAYCENLAELTGEENIRIIGDYAFALTVIPGVDLSSAESIGTQAFYKDKYSSFTLVLGENLKHIGENPFAYCKIAPFSSVVYEDFNGTSYPKTTYTYDINEYITIIDGSIYKVVPNGVTLITWTGSTNAELPEGTVRISDMAFAGSDLVRITLPTTLKAIGHKAFYECMRLAYVSFLGYRAPILEEEYDELYWISAEHIAATGDYTLDYTDGHQETVSGLGVVPYFVWNATTNATNVFYGATFVDYVGLVGANNDKGFAEDTKLTLVRPVNGIGYDSFIMEQYFGVVIDGNAAADDITLAAIEILSKLPVAKDIKLSHKSLVAEARAAYEKVLTNQQRALIPASVFNLLTQAEQKISDLEYIQNSGNTNTKPTDPDNQTGNAGTTNPDPIPTPNDTVIKPDKKLDGKTVAIIFISIGAAVLLGLLVTAVILLIKAKQPKKKVILQFGGKPNEK